MKMQKTTATQLVKLLNVSVQASAGDEVELSPPAEALIRDAVARQALDDEIDNVNGHDN